MTALAQYLTSRRRDTEPRAEGMGLRIVDLLLVLPELSWRWLVFLGPWSVDQRRGLLCPITTVEPQYAGPPRPYPRAPRLGPRAFSIGVVNSFGDNFVL